MNEVDKKLDEFLELSIELKEHPEAVFMFCAAMFVALPKEQRDEAEGFMDLISKRMKDRAA